MRSGVHPVIREADTCPNCYVLGEKYVSGEMAIILRALERYDDCSFSASAVENFDL